MNTNTQRPLTAAELKLQMTTAYQIGCFMQWVEDAFGTDDDIYTNLDEYASDFCSAMRAVEYVPNGDKLEQLTASDFAELDELINNHNEVIHE